MKRPIRLFTARAMPIGKPSKITSVTANRSGFLKRRQERGTARPRTISGAPRAIARCAHPTLANDGKIFSWNDPPPTGHPGEDFGCRCFAQAYDPEVQEFAHQTLTSAAGGAAIKWDIPRFLFHFAFGGGATVTLSQIGHLRGIIDFYANTLGIYERVNGQIANAARQSGSGSFQYELSNGYDFTSYNSMIEGATVSGVFSGSATQNNNALEISGTVTYEFRDVFTDPLNIREFFIGSSDPDAVNSIVRWITDFGGTDYVIEDTWTTTLEALVNADRNKSRFAG